MRTRAYDMHFALAVEGIQLVMRIMSRLFAAGCESIEWQLNQIE